MKKLVLGTLICLAACGEFETELGSPEDHAVPEIAPDELGLARSRVLLSPDRHIRFIQPDDWELYHYQVVPSFSYFRDVRGPEIDHFLSGVFYHAEERVLCHVISEVQFNNHNSVSRVKNNTEDQMDYVYQQVVFSEILDGYFCDIRMHPDNKTTPGSVHEMQWTLLHGDTDYPALGFGVADSTDQTSTHAFCHWIDGARGDNEVELLTQVRAAVRFVGVG